MPKLAKKPKQRVHREWFKQVSRGNRKSCPTCKAKLEQGEWIWSWGEYVYGKFRAIRDVCKNCWSDLVSDLKDHTDDCGCTVELVAYHAQKPAWMTLEAPCCVHQPDVRQEPAEQQCESGEGRGRVRQTVQTREDDLQPDQGAPR